MLRTNNQMPKMPRIMSDRKRLRHGSIFRRALGSLNSLKIAQAKIAKPRSAPTKYLECSTRETTGLFGPSENGSMPAVMNTNRSPNRSKNNDSQIV